MKTAQAQLTPTLSTFLMIQARVMKPVRIAYCPYSNHRELDLGRSSGWAVRPGHVGHTATVCFVVGRCLCCLSGRCSSLTTQTALTCANWAGALMVFIIEYFLPLGTIPFSGFTVKSFKSTESSFTFKVHYNQQDIIPYRLYRLFHYHQSYPNQGRCLLNLWLAGHTQPTSNLQVSIYISSSSPIYSFPNTAPHLGEPDQPSNIVVQYSSAIYLC